MNYSPLVQQYFDQPANLGRPGESASPDIRGEAGSIELGTWILIQGRVDSDRLVDLNFLAYGCPHTIAACSRTVEKLSGEGVCELLNFAPDQAINELDIPVEKAGKMLILQDALRGCFEDWDSPRGEADGR